MTSSVVRRMRRLAVVAGVMASSAPLLAGTTSYASPVVWNYPSACNGASTLQQCIDNAAAGDTVAIDTDTPINESASMEKSLTLEAAQGYHPTIQGAYADDGAGAAVDVTVRGIKMTGSAGAGFHNFSGDSFTLDHVTASGGFAGSQAVYDYVTVPASLAIIKSSFTYTGNGVGVLVQASQAGGKVTARLVGNSFSSQGQPEVEAAIELYSDNTGGLDAVVANNSVFKAGTCNCGNASAFDLEYMNSSTSHVDIVGNTVDRAPVGVGVGDTMTGGRLTLRAFNNVFSRGRTGIYLSADIKSTLRFSAGHNEYYRIQTQVEGRSAGSGNLHVPPYFRDENHGDLRLKSTSPLIDRALVCSPAGIAQPDARGHARRSGPGVDVGAFEYGATAPTGVVVVGTSGPDSRSGTPGADIMCGYGGGDHLWGMGDWDYIDGGSGDDVVSGNNGYDLLYGGGGNDTVVGGTGNDLIYGGSGNDCLNSQDRHGRDRVFGGSGTDGARSDAYDDLVSVERSAC
jgi:hypothetical protein